VDLGFHPPLYQLKKIKIVSPFYNSREFGSDKKKHPKVHEGAGNKTD
jgi:hypothetical protein